MKAERKVISHTRSKREAWKAMTIKRKKVVDELRRGRMSGNGEQRKNAKKQGTRPETRHP